MFRQMVEKKTRSADEEIRSILAAADAGSRALTDGETERVKALRDEVIHLQKEFDGDEALRKQVEQLGAWIGDSHGQSGAPGVPAKGTIGEQFVGDPAWNAFCKKFAPGGRVSDQMKFTSDPVMYSGFGLFPQSIGRKTLITGESDTSAGAFVQTDYTGIYEPLGRQALTVRGLISVRQTMSDLVQFVRQTVKYAAAAPVAEANVADYSGATGEVSGLKPEGELGWETVTEAVKVIAATIPATTRALSDASQIRGIIDQELRADIAEELEDQIINGDGTGEHFTGILNTSGILTQAWDTDILTTTRKAKTALLTTGRVRPTAWMINPADWETIELLKDGNNRYYWGGPLDNGRPQLWGIPIVESETIAEGTGLLGDWRKAVLWDREIATLQVSTQHEDYFTRNMVMFLAEMRGAFGLIRPSAFIEVDLSSGS